jgi:polyhydroxyalkanoate synthesis regulator phasin
MRQDRIIQQLDAMVVAGRLTPEEAARLRAAEGTPEFEAAVNDVRARHAGAHMEAAVAEGEMTQDEADSYLARVRGGEHPDGQRARLRPHRTGRHSS